MTEEIRMQDNANPEETRESVQEEAPTARSAAEPADSMEMAQVSPLKVGDVVKGKVVKVEDNHALVDVGYKYDGIIPIRELSSIPLQNAGEAVSVGDEVELKVLSIDEEKERLVLSKRAVDSVRAWEELKGKYERREIIEAKVADVVKGGLVVDLGVRGFVPASMVELHYVEDFSGYKGRTLRLRIKEIDPEANKLILSQKDVLEEELEARKKEILANLEPNQVLEGTVQRLTPFGVFVDIGGIDGLVHISEMAWTHVVHPSELVKEGDRVTVKVLRVDPEKEKISLSMKAVSPGPWEQAAEKFRIGDIVEGTVKRIVSFGAFVEIYPGVEGLVHISQIAHRHIGTPHEVLKEGQQVKAKILDFQPSEKRVSLSIKETEEPPAPRQEKARSVELPPAQGLSLTLGERLGDKLSKFKP